VVGDAPLNRGGDGGVVLDDDDTRALSGEGFPKVIGVLVDIQRAEVDVGVYPEFAE